MKKSMKFIIIIWALLIIGALIYFNKDKLFSGMNYTSLGYSETSSEKIKELKLKTYLNETYYKTLDKALETDEYVNDYLQDYVKIDYIDNKDFIKSINHLLEKKYSSEEINDLSFILSSKYYKYDLLDSYLEYYKKNKDKKDDIVILTNIGLNNDFYTNIREVKDPDNLLVLVNKYNKLPDDYEPTNLEDFDIKYKISKYEKPMRKEAHDALIKLIDDINKQGMNLWINSTFRTKDYQNGLFTKSVKNNGMAHALIYSAKMRHSEHETGLAVDMSSVKGMLDGFEKYPEYKWLIKNAHKYGFIERYPKGKEWITGYAYEPWHYRYVGVEAATKIKEEEITFEEYAVKYLGYY
jgi:D-alanyl-D-alanine carboxypeptidase